jgi:hypothetical protein
MDGAGSCASRNEFYVKRSQEDVTDRMIVDLV